MYYTPMTTRARITLAHLHARGCAARIYPAPAPLQIRLREYFRAIISHLWQTRGARWWR